MADFPDEIAKRRAWKQEAMDTIDKWAVWIAHLSGGVVITVAPDGTAAVLMEDRTYTGQSLTHALALAFKEEAPDGGPHQDHPSNGPSDGPADRGAES